MLRYGSEACSDMGLSKFRYGSFFIQIWVFSYARARTYFLLCLCEAQSHNLPILHYSIIVILEYFTIPEHLEKVVHID